MSEAKSWFSGCKAGNDMVFEFLKEMEKVPAVEELRKEFDGWCNADYVKLPSGMWVDKSSGETMTEEEYNKKHSQILNNTTEDK